MRRFWISIAACGLLLGSAADARERFKVLSERSSGDLERALNEAGAAGWRFAGSQGGKSTFGMPNHAVLVMVRGAEGRKFRYRVLATMRTGTMERELNDVPPEFSFVGTTAFLGEGAVILEAADDPGTSGTGAGVSP